VGGDVAVPAALDHDDDKALLEALSMPIEEAAAEGEPKGLLEKVKSALPLFTKPAEAETEA